MIRTTLGRSGVSKNPRGDVAGVVPPGCDRSVPCNILLKNLPFMGTGHQSSEHGGGPAEQEANVLRGASSLMVIVFLCAPSPAIGQLAEASPPPIAHLRALSYEQVDLPRLNGKIPSITDLATITESFEAYVYAMTYLQELREPIVTRGTQGIAVYRKVCPAIVLIATGHVVANRFLPSGLGTGVVIGAKGQVLTNWHVVSGSQAFLLFFKPTQGLDLGKAVGYAATVLTTSQATDLALLQIVNPPPGLSPLIVADDGGIEVAQDIHIIGHPRGEVWTYTTGVISQIRDGYSWQYDDGSVHTSDVLQLQTAVNPGSSGGPVLDDSGRLIGLIVFGDPLAENMHFAVRADEIRKFLAGPRQIRTRGLGHQAPSTVVRYAAATSESGARIIRAAHENLELYFMLGRHSTVVGLVSLASSTGRVITASDPNTLGQLRSWAYASLDGKILVRASAEGTLPAVFSPP